MSTTSLIEMDDAAEHVIEDPTALELADDKARLKSQVLASEILFANYDTDDELTSKRGGKELTLGGVNNTGSVSGSKLTLAVDRSYGEYAITEIVDDFTVRFAAFYNRSAVPGTPTQMAYLQSSVDSSRIEWRYQNQGGGVMRIYCRVVNSSGVEVTDFQLGTQTAALNLLTNVAVSNDDDGNLLMFFNGALVNTIASPAFDFSTCTLRLGNNGTTNAAASFDNVQVFSSPAITSPYAFPFPEPTTYVLTEQVMETKIPLRVDEVTFFDVVSEIPTGSALGHLIQLDGERYRYNSGSDAFEVIDYVADLLPQANTKDEIADNLDKLPVVKGIGKTLEIVHVFQSTSGYATPLIESVTVKYKYTFKSGDIPICAVHGVVLDNGGNAVEGAKIWVESDDKFKNNGFIGPRFYVLSNAMGKYTIGVPETETTGLGVTFVIEYLESEPNGATPIQEYVTFRHENKIVPNLPTAELETLDDAA